MCTSCTMQDTDCHQSTNSPAATQHRRAMSPYTTSSKYGSPASSRTPSPCIPEPTSHHLHHHQHSAIQHNEMIKDEETKYMSDDEISVGCPSPALLTSTNYQSTADPMRSPTRYQSPTDYRCPTTNTTTTTTTESTDSEEYFKPLKKLKMVKEAAERRISPTVEPAVIEPAIVEPSPADGVKSFSIMDILSHRPVVVKPQKIVRPWDLEPEEQLMEVAQHHHREHQNNLERFHRQLKAHHQHQLALLRPEFASAFNAAAAAAAAAAATSCYASETGSDRSSSVASDCCSPELVGTSSGTSGQRQRQQQQGSGQKQQPSGTPLDALFQMTSKTFDSTAGESSTDGQSHLNLFNNRSQPKKKRKSRTAFTNHQIFELEKRFLYQKYLSPADRDEIAGSLGLTNAQVITWFQNRRAKLKRDMEELKKDVENTKILNAHKSFLENVQDLGILKKKALLAAAAAAEDECSPKNLVMSGSGQK